MRRRASILCLFVLLLACPEPGPAEVCEPIWSGSANAGDACKAKAEGEVCSYGDDCGSCSFECRGGVWTLVGCDSACDTLEAGQETAQTSTSTESGDGDGDPGGTIDTGLDTETGAGTDTGTGA